MSKLTDADAAYLAGLIDGEGHVSVNKVQPSDQHIPNYRGVVGITNTSPVLMEKIKQLVPECFITFIKSRGANWKDHYVVNFSQTSLLWILPEVIPYLTIKKHRAELVLNLIRLKFSKGAASLEQQETIRQEVSRQNQRGKASQKTQVKFNEKKVRTCNYEGCSSKHYGNGYCRKHYRWVFESKSWQSNKERICKNCSGFISEEVRLDSKFCCVACKMDWHREQGCYTEEALQGSRICSVEGCGRPHHSRDFCRRHYMQFWWKENGTR
jgi:hypothetical protein